MNITRQETTEYTQLKQSDVVEQSSSITIDCFVGDVEVITMMEMIRGVDVYLQQQLASVVMKKERKKSVDDEMTMMMTMIIKLE